MPSLVKLELGIIGVTSINYHDAPLNLENLPNLTTLILGDYVFESPRTCVIRDLPELKEIHLGTNALYLFKTSFLRMENLPKLEIFESLGSSLTCSKITITG